MNRQHPSALYHVLTFLRGCFVILAFTGCGGGQSCVADEVHACELFTVAEIETLIGAPVDKPPAETHKVQKESKFWMSMCNYYAPEPGVSLGIMVRPFPPQQPTAAEAYEVYVQDLKAGMPDYQMSPVGDVGVKAFWNESMKQLTVFGERYMLIVTSMMRDSADAQRLALAREVAAAALTRLP